VVTKISVKFKNSTLEHPGIPILYRKNTFAPPPLKFTSLRKVVKKKRIISKKSILTNVGILFLYKKKRKDSF